MRKVRLAVAVAAAALTVPLAVPGVAGALPASNSGAAKPWLDSSLPVEKRIDLLLAQMTNAEKASLMTSVGVPSGSHATGYTPGVARLGIPGMQFSDGPAGVRDGQPATAMPSPVSLAASFDPQVAKSYGTVLGAEAKSRGYQVLYGPMVNIVRTPLGGRDFETLGEDPELAGDLASAEIRGIQSQGVAAQVKHYAGNDQENARDTSSSNIDERTLHEIYLPAFEKAVKDGKVWSVMCAYNKVNGVYSCENAQILRDVLIDTWKFDGVVDTDYPANHSTVTAALAGLDQEFAGTSYFQQLPAAVAAGQVPQSVLDDAARRILRLEFRTGLFDPQTPPTADFEADSAVARQTAEDGSVLLKNNNATLPLDTGKLSSLAVIGPNADTAVTGGGGSSAVTPYKTVDPVSGLKARLGSAVDVNYVKAGSSSLPVIPASALSGLKSEYFTNTTLSGTPALTRDEKNIDFDWGAGSPANGIPVDRFSARYTGTLTAPVTDTYTLSSTSDDGTRVYLDDKLIVDNWGDHAAQTVTSAPIQLTAGEQHSIRVEYYEDGQNASVSLGWSAPSLPDSSIQAAVAAAKKADAAVVVVGDSSTEGSDRTTLALPGNEDALIAAVAAANPKTVVVLRAGAPVLMPWLDKVPAVLDTWYPGQEDGSALAALLTGDAEPGGRLPVSFPKTETQTAVAAAPGRYPAVNGVYDYSEKLDVGYRWYQATDQTPLFPFGYGLSYTTFKVAHLTRSAGQVTGGAGTTDKVTLSVDVTNTGKRTGSDVVQAYIGHPKSAGEPPNALKAFAKVTLKPGQARTVTLTLDSDALRTWDTDAHDWTVLDGTYPISVGESSANTPLTTSVTVNKTQGTQYTSATAAPVTQPGSTQTVKQTFTNTGDTAVRALQLSLTAPGGWTVKPGAGQVPAPATVPAHSSVSTTWQVTAPADGADPATLTAHASYTLNGATQARTGTATTVVPYSKLSDAYNNKGITADDSTTPGNLDPAGYTFAASQLAAVGYTPGAHVTANGLSYQWPDTQPGQTDNVAAAGQVIDLQGQGGKLGLLGTGISSAHSGTVTVTYTDGTTDAIPITFPDWWSNAASGNSQLAVTTANWYRHPGDTIGDHAVSLYTTGGALDPTKTVATITLPNDTGIHVFAATIG
ncbi:glycoside hydrolase family 3 C-terminal domain-containing protein [Streptomyces sp. NPDC051976]|uniref:glycoside hydrolase family 3 C-terminal domain-containing protein n=1 Tax=Streptomyces sp. NPDC051976 TaxID=3154947 RepID=UPI003439BE58